MSKVLKVGHTAVILLNSTASAIKEELRHVPDEAVYINSYIDTEGLVLVFEQKPQ